MAQLPRPAGRRALGLAPVVSFALIGLLLVVFLLLNFEASQGTEESNEFVRTIPWITWVTVAAAAVMVFVLLMIFGVRLLLEHRDRGSLAARSWFVGYLLAAAALVALIITGILLGASRAVDRPVQDLSSRTRAVLVSGLAAAIPWLAIAWLRREECRPAAHRVWDMGRAPEYQDLQRLRKLIYSCVGAFAVGVVAALMTSGALRFAFPSVAKECGADWSPLSGRSDGPRCVEDFPPTTVLLFGAVFALILVVVAMPLIVAWRARALEWVERQSPAPAEQVPTAQWTEEASRLRDLLGLNTPLLRDPLTLLSVFTPLGTSALAAFLPQLGS